MEFWKMNGAGNDFILLNNLKEHLPEEAFPDIARTLCERHLSIGADGLMVVDAPVQGGDYRMRFYNSDGSVGEMCGNGARCIARYGFEHGLAGKTQRIETTAGLVTGERITDTLYRIRLNDPSVIDLERSVEGYACSYIELGDPGIPHAVVVMDDWDEVPHDELFSLGKKLRFSPAFPKGANVSFVKLVGKDRIKAVTFERGVEDFTLACGTGSGSIVTALTQKGLVSGENVTVSMPGGDLFVTVKADGAAVHDIYLTGPTCKVCEGEICFL